MSLGDENNMMDLSAFRLAAVRGSFNPDGTKFVPIFRPLEPGALDQVSLHRRMANIGPMTPIVQTLRPVRPPAFQAYMDFQSAQGEWSYEGRCLICSLDEHTSSECPYNTEVPKNAIVGSGCDVFCKVCDYLFSERCCNQNSGRAKLKYCNLCSSYGEHWHVLCPRRSGEYVLNPPGHLTKYARRNKSGV